MFEFVNVKRTLEIDYPLIEDLTDSLAWGSDTRPGHKHLVFIVSDWFE